jgi:ABC-type multidrug transport system ATPase subunit
VDGLSVRTQLGARARLGLLAHESYLYPSLTARENLRLYATLFNLPRAEPRIDAVLAEVGLDWAHDLPVEGFSRGMEQRAALARVLLHDPGVLLLDEPFAGLDQAAEGFLLRKLEALAAAGKTVLLVTHDPLLAARATRRAVVLRRGRIALDEPLDPGLAASFAARYTALLEEGGRR